MINLDNFVGVDGWPCHGFLGGHNILDVPTYESIKKFNYYHLVENPVYDYKRRSLGFTAHSTHNHVEEPMQTLQNLINYLDNFELMEHLITKSFGTPDFTINNVWSGGIDTLRRLYKGPYLMVNEDGPFMLHPHSDNRTLIANIQIYLEPYNLECGTTFHMAKDWDYKRTLPFIPNTGYFLVNSDLGIHSVVNDQPLPRRSLLMGWMI